MDASIVICTFNRASQVGSLLSSLERQSTGNCQLEVIVVDNCSTDNTAEVVRRVAGQTRLPIHYIYEFRQGKSFALNSGVRKAAGELVLFLDDDVRLAPTWLGGMLEAFESREWGGIAGRILPEFENDPPDWMDSSAAYPFKYDFGEEVREVHAPPFGANMAYRKSVIEAAGEFRTDLGPAWGGAGLGEDSEFGQRVINMGEKIVYWPKALVWHPVDEKQSSRKFMLDWYRRYGASLVQRGEIDVSGAKIGGIPRYVLRMFLQNLIRWQFTLAPKRRFYSKLAFYRTWGTISELKNAPREQWSRDDERSQ